MNIPSLAIHLDRTQNEAFKPNLETHLKPVIASQLKSPAPAGAAAGSEPAHHDLLLTELAEQVGCKAEDIADFELCLYNHQPAAIGGAKHEFIYSARLDNLLSSYCALAVCLRL